MKTKMSVGPGGSEAQATSAGHSYTVVYDGDCEVCTRMVGVLARLDRDNQLEIVSSHSTGLPERFPWIPAQAYSESVQVVRTADGQTWRGAAAIEQLLDVLPKGRIVSWIFSIPAARPIAERLYRLFARNRYRLGCDRHGT
jgi:predicted DCC family thiol-disulfide oxidoreductase YuxK